MKKQSKSESIKEYFLKYENQSIILPSRFLPDKEFLDYHNSEEYSYWLFHLKPFRVIWLQIYFGNASARVFRFDSIILTILPNPEVHLANTVKFGRASLNIDPYGLRSNEC